MSARIEYSRVRRKLRVNAVSIECSDATGAAYRVVGDVGPLVRRHARGFLYRHPGVLVGSGSLNNRNLTVTVGVLEGADGTVTAAIVDLSP